MRGAPGAQARRTRLSSTGAQVAERVIEVVPRSDKPRIKRPIQVLHAPELQARLATRLHIPLPPGSERKKRRSPDHAEPNLVLSESCRRVRARVPARSSRHFVY